MGLISRLGAYAAVSYFGLANILFNSGCENMENPATGLAILSAAAGVRSDNLARNGDYDNAARVSAAGQVLGGMADYQKNMDISRARANQQTININYPGQPDQRTGQNPFTVYIGNGWGDKNGDGVFEIGEEIGLGRTRFSSFEDIEIGVMGINNPQCAVKLLLKDIRNNATYESEFLMLYTSRLQRWPCPAGSLKPGIYKINVVTENNSNLGEILFEVTP